MPITNGTTRVRRTQVIMKYLLAWTGTTPDAPERVIGALVVGLTAVLLGGSALVLAWAFALVR
jgi:hypothetical protein